MSTAGVTTKCHVDVHGLGCHLRPCGHLRAMLLLGKISSEWPPSEAHVTIKGHVDVSYLGCYLRKAMFTSEHCAELALPLSRIALGELALEAWLPEVWFCH